MTAALDRQRVARAVLLSGRARRSGLAALLDVSEPADIVAAVAAGRLPAWLAGRLSAGAPGAVPRRRARVFPRRPRGNRVRDRRTQTRQLSRPRSGPAGLAVRPPRG